MRKYSVEIVVFLTAAGLLLGGFLAGNDARADVTNPPFLSSKNYWKGVNRFAQTPSIDTAAIDMDGLLLSFGCDTCESVQINAAGNTSVVLPESGTLSTLDGAETLSNKTIVNSPSITATRATLGTASGSSTGDATLDLFGDTNAVLHAHNTGAQSTTGGAAIISYAVPTGAAMLSGNRLGAYVIGGHRTAAGDLQNSAAVSGFTTENWSNTAAGSELRLETTPNGTTTRTERMRIRSDGGVGIGGSGSTSANLRLQRNMSGGSTVHGVYLSSTVQSDASNAVGFLSSVNTQATTFTLNNLYHFFADQTALGAGSTLNTQYGYIANATLIGASFNYGFYGAIPSGTNRWNLYMAGTAANHLAGTTLIGTATDNGVDKLQVTGSARISSTLKAGGGSANKAVCWKSDGVSLGYCSTQPDAGGACTCN